ncbi:hypothetical protein EIY87_09335 [Amycolatopsis eburnea]|uniref:Uncharacterized protein n=1 Tax=Amycolatopsis eburnea TaxID=2267691 RepID=A0A427TGI6_9PSEU|nr:hypothetical protein EIY87_09335 [Amycolatopsis eburnea]
MELLTHWALVEADLHELYGVDAGDLALMKARPWRWLRVRIQGLLQSPDTRVHRVFFPPPPPPDPRRR